MKSYVFFRNESLPDTNLHVEACLVGYYNYDIIIMSDNQKYCYEAIIRQ